MSSRGIFVAASARTTSAIGSCSFKAGIITVIMYSSARPRSCSSGYFVHNAFVAQDLLRFAEVIADVGLRLDPIQVAPDPSRKIHLWLITGCANAGGVARQMAHLARTKFSFGLRRDMNLERGGNLLGNLANRHPAAATDVRRQSIKLVCLGGEQIGARDIFNKGKVACLLSVFIKDRRQVVQ